MKSDDVRSNEVAWDASSDDYEANHAEQLGRELCAWGVFSRPERELNVLGDVADRDILELGCGAARWSIGLAQRGGRVTGVDLSSRQLAHATRLIAEHGEAVTLVHADAEDLPFADASFDIVFCDHGAMSFANPRRTVPEVARILRPGGLFAFSMSTPIRDICDAGPRLESSLVHDYFGFERIAEDGFVSTVLTYGEAIRLFRRHAFEIVDLIELQPRPHEQTTYTTFAPITWARRWPAEHIWKVRKR